MYIGGWNPPDPAEQWRRRCSVQKMKSSPGMQMRVGTYPQTNPLAKAGRWLRRPFFKTHGLLLLVFIQVNWVQRGLARQQAPHVCGEQSRIWMLLPVNSQLWFHSTWPPSPSSQLARADVHQMASSRNSSFISSNWQTVAKLWYPL